MARTIAKDHDEKRGAILRTAARFFADNGYDRSSMSQLAAECGVSKALIYHYYNSKEALLFGIVDSHLTRLVDAVEAVNTTGEDPEQDLRSLVQTILGAYKDADAEHKVQLEAMAWLPEADRRHLSDLQRRLVAIVAEALQRIAPEKFASDPASLRPITMSLFGMLNWFYMWYRKGGGITRDEYADLATDLLLGGLHGINAKAP